MITGDCIERRCSSLGLTIGYFWVTLLVMFILYVFIYRVARALEQRSRANAQKFSKSMANSKSISSKGPRRLPTLRSSSLCFRTKKKKKKKHQKSFDDDVGSSFLNHPQPKRVSNGLDGTNRSSSNENSAEHPPNILTMTRVRDGSLKALEENRSLLPLIADKVTFPNVNRQKSSVRTGTSNKARKALRTITVIMGAFVLCWTPVSSERVRQFLLSLMFAAGYRTARLAFVQRANALFSREC